MTLRKIKKTALNIMQASGALRLAQFPMHEAGNHLFVLAYHRIAEIKTPLERRLYDLVTALPYQFAQQMKLLADCFHPITAEDVLNALNGGKPLPAQSVLVTVDDGYRDFKETIFPIAKKYGIRPILFLPTAFVEHGIFWWDRLHNAITNTALTQIQTPLGVFPLTNDSEKQAAFNALADHVRAQPFETARAEIELLCDEITPEAHANIPHTLTWDELRALSTQGVTIAPHTHRHPILTHIPLEEVREEIRIARDWITREVVQPLPIFAYPDGRDHAVNAKIAAILKEEGIQIAFTMSDRISHLKQDHPQLFPRIVPHRSLSLAQFHLRLTAFHENRR